MKKPQSQAKSQRRLYEQYLKKTNMAAYKEWKAGAKERGEKIHQQNEDAVRRAEEERLEAIQTGMIQSMRAEGKTDAEIDEHISDWVKTLKLWGSSERPLRMREVKKEKNLEIEKSKSND